jgi:hypothetical protein
MVARRGSHEDGGSSMTGQHPHPRAIIKAHREASPEDTGPGLQSVKAAGQTSIAGTSLQGMPRACHPEPCPERSEWSSEGPPSLAHLVTPSPSCHPERSEGSRLGGAEMLRCAQHDNTVLLPRQQSMPRLLTLSDHPNHSSTPSFLQHLLGFSRR